MTNKDYEIHPLEGKPELWNAVDFNTKVKKTFPPRIGEPIGCYNFRVLGVDDPPQLLVRDLGNVAMLSFAGNRPYIKLIGEETAIDRNAEELSKKTGYKLVEVNSSS